MNPEIAQSRLQRAWAQFMVGLARRVAETTNAADLEKQLDEIVPALEQLAEKVGGRPTIRYDPTEIRELPDVQDL